MKRCGTRCRLRASAQNPHGSRPGRAGRPTAVARLLVCSALLWSFGGCVTKGAYDDVAAERDRLTKEQRELLGKVERLEAANQSFGSERVELIDQSEDLNIANRRLESELARVTRERDQLARDFAQTQAALANRESEIEKMRGTYDVLISDLESEVASGQIQIEKLRSGLTMNLSEDILFPSGSAAINAGGTAVLRKVGRRLNELPHSVAVRGHTDDVPIAGRYPSNWELAAARASSVVRLLAEVGVDPARLTVVSRAEYEPVVSNDTAEGRARNRRIEIRLEPTAEDSAPASPAVGEPGGEAEPTGDAALEVPGEAEAERAPAS